MSESPAAPLRILQIAPEIASGSGVGGVAFELERQFQAAGAITSRFTLADAGLPGRHGAVGRLRRAHNVLWFSTIGTLRARRRLRAHPEVIAICHNDVLAGDIYVNHGVVQVSLRARGHYRWRMIRNPLHLFTVARDRHRYRSDIHRAVVALSSKEAVALRGEYGRVRPPIEVIPNGVDLDRFRPPNAGERADAREFVGADPRSFVAVFIGHEFERKGLPVVLDALADLPEVRLVVVGGSPADIRHAEMRIDDTVRDRVVFLGTTPDSRPPLWASDALVIPSAYEANALVVLEALACGVPVVATPVGAAPDLIGDSDAGRLVPRDPARIAEALRDLARSPREETARAARVVAEKYGWPLIAQRYLDLVRRLDSSTRVRT